MDARLREHILKEFNKTDYRLQGLCMCVVVSACLCACHLCVCAGRKKDRIRARDYVRVRAIQELRK